MARKRAFSEIVDLTQDLSDEETPERVTKEPRHDDPSEHPVRNANVSQENITEDGPDQTPHSSKILELSKYKLPETDTSAKNESLRRRPDIAKLLNKAEALRKSYYDPKTIARDILVAAGRHPTERPLNSHLAKLRENFSAVDHSSDLRTFRWDLVDPGGPPQPEVAPAPLISWPPRMKPFQSLSQDSGADESHDVPRDLPESHSPRAQNPHKPSRLRISCTVNSSDKPNYQISPQVHETSQMSSTPSIPGPRRRGRPPGARNRPKLSTPSSLKTSKRIEIAVPVRAKSLSPSSSYSIYGCEWQDCGAQLHNLDTLRRHVMKIHANKPEHNATCMWAGCGVGNNNVGDQTTRKTFTSEGLCEHVENIHLAHVAWTMGDGPAAAGSGETGYPNQPIFIP
jgi:hypothetical protein